MDFSTDGEPSVDFDALQSEHEDNDQQLPTKINEHSRANETEAIRSVTINFSKSCKLLVYSGPVDEQSHQNYQAAVSGEDFCISLPRTMGAWGSGQHPTTQLSCRQLLELKENVRGNEILDFGCGSGILTILTALIGCTRAVGVDIEPTAVESSRCNAAFNGVAARCSFHLPPAEFLRGDIDFFCRYGDWSAHTDQLLPADAGPFGIVVANILPGPLLRLAPLLCRLCRPGGLVCLAGMRPFQAEALRAAYAAGGVTLAPSGTMRDESGEEWISLRGAKTVAASTPLP